MPSQQITIFTIFQPKECPDLENTTPSDPSHAVKTFTHLTDILKDQKGFIRQYWGYQVENPELFVWATDWEAFEHHATWHKTQEQAQFWAGVTRFFGVETTAPVTLFTRVVDTEGATAAFRSGVTEVAFFTMPTRPDGATRSAIEAGSENVLRDVQKIGKASGAAIGWVFDAEPKAVVSSADSVSLYGIFGYANIDVHMRWRETPEGKKYGEPSTTVLPATVVPGVDSKTGYFHVKFQEGS